MSRVTTLALAVLTLALLLIVAAANDDDEPNSQLKARMSMIKEDLFQVLTSELGGCDDVTTGAGVARCNSALTEYLQVVDALRHVFRTASAQKPRMAGLEELNLADGFFNYPPAAADDARIPVGKAGDTFQPFMSERSIETAVDGDFDDFDPAVVERMGAQAGFPLHASFSQPIEVAAPVADPATAEEVAAAADKLLDLHGLLALDPPAEDAGLKPIKIHDSVTTVADIRAFVATAQSATKWHVVIANRLVGGFDSCVVPAHAVQSTKDDLSRLHIADHVASQSAYGQSNWITNMSIGAVSALRAYGGQIAACIIPDIDDRLFDNTLTPVAFFGGWASLVMLQPRSSILEGDLSSLRNPGSSSLSQVLQKACAGEYLHCTLHAHSLCALESVQRCSLTLDVARANNLAEQQFVGAIDFALHSALPMALACLYVMGREKLVLMAPSAIASSFAVRLPDGIIRKLWPLYGYSPFDIMGDNGSVFDVAEAAAANLVFPGGDASVQQYLQCRDLVPDDPFIAAAAQQRLAVLRAVSGVGPELELKRLAFLRNMTNKFCETNSDGVKQESASSQLRNLIRNICSIYIRAAVVAATLVYSKAVEGRGRKNDPVFNAPPPSAVLRAHSPLCARFVDTLARDGKGEFILDVDYRQTVCNNVFLSAVLIDERVPRRLDRATKDDERRRVLAALHGGQTLPPPNPRARDTGKSRHRLDRRRDFAKATLDDGSASEEEEEEEEEEVIEPPPKKSKNNVVDVIVVAGGSSGSSSSSSLVEAAVITLPAAPALVVAPANVVAKRASSKTGARRAK